MLVTVVPASTKTGAATARSLLAKHVQVRGIYIDLSKIPAAFSANANIFAIEGHASDEGTFDLTGSDAVLAIIPPVFDGRDLIEHAEKISSNIKSAIELAGNVKRLVLLSSEGAEFSKSTSSYGPAYHEDQGEIKTNHKAEEVLWKRKVESAVFVRCAYFMENWTVNLATLKGPDLFFFSTITPVDFQILMVSISDIGATLADPLTGKEALPTKPYIVELHGPQKYSPLVVRGAFTQALGKEVELRPVEKERLRHFYAKIFPPTILDCWLKWG
ncbi:uncharacterized protein N7506_005753 [Penicillium brevicompactum]|uniref:uncharacterized protein n=1 Tax=Penicillium brevicompactum TaxID=5074 RepID=UPI002541269A|nr:uncharacterized protein N7506_005753 [Penicillium brevicompactum]KAJ5335817.1 hypothetical protein N7506_005753 [Penicillium brevicompactum]